MKPVTKAQAIASLKSWRRYAVQQARAVDTPLEARHWEARARSATIVIARLRDGEL